MSDIKIMRCLKPTYNKSLILSRLGYHKNRTVIPADAMHEVERLIFDAERTLCITAAYRIMNILQIIVPKIILEDGTILSGQRLSELLKNSRQALIMGATGGKKIMELIDRLQAEGRMSEAVVIDAAASEITDSALDLVMNYVEQSLRPKGKFLTKMRFSHRLPYAPYSYQRTLHGFRRPVTVGQRKPRRRQTELPWQTSEAFRATMEALISSLHRSFEVFLHQMPCPEVP
jgi:hypothetical protein